MIKPDTLTSKQQVFVREFVEKKNAREAAKVAYEVKSDLNASAIAYSNLRKPKIQKAIELAFEKKGVTVDKVAQRIAEGMDAKVVTQYQGEAVETEIPDQNLREKWTRDAIEVLGLKAPEKNLNLNMDLEVARMSDEELKSALKEALKELETENASAK